MSALRHALIMAAGRGTRMMPLTADIPKPMASLQGTTLIGRGVEALRHHIECIHITVGYKGALLGRHVLDLGVDSVLNVGDHGNAWWLYNTLMRFVQEPIVVLTCDNVVDLDLELLMQDHAALGEPACMVVPVRPVAGLEGDFIFHEDQVISALDRHTPSDSYCSGIQILNPGRINALTHRAEDFSDVWRQLMELRQLYCSRVYPKRWFAVDTVGQLADLRCASTEAPSRSPHEA